MRLRILLLRGEQRRQIVFQPLQPDVHHVRKAGFFRFHDVGDALLAVLQLRIRRFHLLRDRKDHLEQERLVRAVEASVADGAPHDFAQHVSASFVLWQHSVADEERRRPRVVGDDSQRRRTNLAITVLCFQQFCRAPNQRLE